MLARRPKFPNPPRQRPVEARMAGRSLNRLNPSAHTVNGPGRIRRIQLRCPRRGGADPRGSPQALRGGWAVVNSLKGANGTPKPSSDVNGVGTRDRLRGASPTNGLWRRSTRSTPGAGLTAGANRTRRARKRGEGVQASSGCRRRAVCVMQKIGHGHGSRTSAGPTGSPCQGRRHKGGQDGRALYRSPESVVR
jgi:hypothetical protein